MYPLPPSRLTGVGWWGSVVHLGISATAFNPPPHHHYPLLLRVCLFSPTGALSGHGCFGLPPFPGTTSGPRHVAAFSAQLRHRHFQKSKESPHRTAAVDSSSPSLWMLIAPLTLECVGFKGKKQRKYPKILSLSIFFKD